MGSVTHVTPYSKSTYKLLVSTWELSINDPNLAHVSETVDDLHHVQPGGIHPPTRHRIQPTPFPSRNATLGTVGKKFAARGHHPAALGFLPFFYYAASNKTTHNHYNFRLLLSQTHAFQVSGSVAFAVIAAFKDWRRRLCV